MKSRPGPAGPRNSLRGDDITELQSVTVNYNNQTVPLLFYHYISPSGSLTFFSFPCEEVVVEKMLSCFRLFLVSETVSQKIVE